MRFFVGVSFLLSIIWTVMILVSFVYALFTSNMQNVLDSIFQSGKTSVDFIFSTGIFMIMWSGFINVAEKSNLTEKFSRLLSPVISFLFKGVRKKSEEERLISLNMTANILGLSNAATPMGIKAMEKLSQKSKNNIATNDMCMFVIINTASLQLIPSTLIALRESFNSQNSSEIIVPIWISSILTVVFAVSLCKFFERR